MTQPSAKSPPPVTGVYVPGVAGRMGRLIAEVAAADDRYSLLGSTVRPGSTPPPLVPAPQTSLTAVIEATQAARGVIVDFTAPAALPAHIDAARAHGFPLLVGTTGLSTKDQHALEAAAEDIPVMLAANTSLGANLTANLVATAARALPMADVDISEIHHNQKKDAPSGTALMLGRSVAEARGQSFEERKRLSREGQAPREPGEIGVFGLRGGDVVGEHTVYYFLDGERVEITHRVRDRSIFARGALFAAAFLAQKAAGRYTMAQALGLS